MNKYRKKPVVVEALQFDGENYAEIFNWMSGIHEFGDYSLISPDEPGFFIKTLEGEHKCSVGDYVIRGIKGEFYPCKPDIFEQTYEAYEAVEE